MKVVADLECCTGHARCQAIAPDVYGTDDLEGKVVLLLETIPDALASHALKGAKGCPERALTVIDEVSGVILWPPAKR